MFSGHNGGKSVVAERFIRILRKKLQISDFNIKNEYIDKLDNIVNNYTNTYHQTYIDFNVEKNYEDPKLKVADNVRTKLN